MKPGLHGAILTGSGLVMAFIGVSGMLFDREVPVLFFIIVLLLALLWLIAGINSFRQKGRVSLKIQLLALLVGCYVVGEIAYNVGVTVKKVSADDIEIDLGFGVFNGPCASYDSIRGFRWDEGQHRISKILNKQVVYDQLFESNNAGIYFDRDYQKAKSDSSVRRYMVFGDSFTSGEYLQKPWPVRFNELAEKSVNTPNVELYSFAINGGGLYNWHSIFFKEVIDEYEFDGIILAVFGNDLERDFFAMEHLEDSGYTAYLQEIPVSRAELMAGHFESMNAHAPYLADSLIDLAVEETKQEAQKRFHFKPRPYLLGVLINFPSKYKQAKKFKTFLKSNLMPADELPSKEEFIGSINEDKFNMLDEMFNWCSKNDKQVIISTLPYEAALPYIDRGQQLIQSAQCKFLAYQYSLDFFDGMQEFANLPKSELSTAFLPFDVHWSQYGSDHFAHSFFNFFSNPDSAGTDN